jgi:photosystem II stability/assembly factor-like uncharacterized protein
MTAARRGCHGSTASTIRNSSTSTQSGRSPAICTSPARGLVLKLDANARRFKALAVPYNGSFFGVADAGTAVLAFGLRGNVFRSADAGATWEKVDAGLPASVVAAARTKDGATLLADAGGRVVRSTHGGRTFAPLAVTPPLPVAGIADVGEGKLALAGPRGVAVAATRAR